MALSKKKRKSLEKQLEDYNSQSLICVGGMLCSALGAYMSTHLLDYGTDLYYTKIDKEYLTSAGNFVYYTGAAILTGSVIVGGWSALEYMSISTKIETVRKVLRSEPENSEESTNTN